MRTSRFISSVAMLLVVSLVGAGCEQTAHGADDLPKPTVDLKAPTPEEGNRVAIFAGGCFWCIEAAFEPLDGVVDAVSGYAGDTAETATYDAVCSGTTKHAESVRIIYDPKKITYGQLLRVFFTIHDPTTKDAQGPDHGHQYRSAIFYQTDEQKSVADAYIKQLTETKSFKDPITTTVEPLGEGFFVAEKYHQDYAKQNAGNPYIQRFAIPKIEKMKSRFGDKLKPAATQPAQ